MTHGIGMALGLHDPALFALSVLVLNATPGVDLVFVVGRTLQCGPRTGLAGAAGISLGCVVHALAAASGLAALLAMSATAFSALKWLGAAYLVWLAAGMLRAAWADPARAPAAAVSPGAADEAPPLGRTFRQGLLTNVLNPKVALFFLAFLPQFIDPASPSKGLGMLFLGVVFTFNGTLWNLFVAWSSATVSSRFKASPAIATWLNRACGGLFLYFSLKLVRSSA